MYLAGDEYEDDYSHPVTAAYPAHDAVGAYPVDNDVVEDDHPNHTPVISEAVAHIAHKKVVEVDKEIVGLMPSHLQKKRRALPKTGKHAVAKSASSNVGGTSIGSTSSKNPRSIGDDYDKFMKELSGL